LRNQATGNADVSLVASRIGANFGSDFYIETSDGVDGTNRKRLNIAEDGDISFYEDTGTTPKFFWDASAERLGIGTSSPSRALNVYSTQQTVSLFEGSGATSQIEIKNSVSQSAIVASSADLYFYVNSAERMRIDSSGNVLLAGNTIFGRNTTDGSDNGYLAVVAGSTESDGRGAITRFYGNEHATNAGRLALSTGNVAGTYMDFRVAGAERLRIDGSGNVLVGKTSAAGYSTEGIELRGGTDNYATFTKDGGTAIYANRLTSDGTIIDLRKDGTTVGSIGSVGGDMYIVTGDTGLRFVDVNDSITATNANGASRDNAVDLGNTGTRFKDLYLSGGVYLGGTTSANKLDDYEEGTWTPVIADAVSGGNTSPTTAASAIYTKIGNLVTIQMNIQNIDTTGMTGANDIHILGLPFTAISLSGSSYFTGALRANVLTFTGNVSVIAGDSSSHLHIAETSSGSGSDLVNVGEISSGSTDFWFSLTYTAA